MTTNNCPPTVTALPKKGQGDFINNAMMVLLSTGELCGWGDNTTGSLANGNAVATNSPAQKVLFDPNTTLPPSTATITDWTFTNANLYVVFSNGWVYSCGQNDYGQNAQGDATTVVRNQLKRIEFFVTNNKTITNVWAAGSHNTTNGGGCVYFLASDWTLYGAGANASGNLGNVTNPTTDQASPVLCSGVPNTTQTHVIDLAVVATYVYFSAYLLMSDGTALVAGRNQYGQLGHGTTSDVTGGFVNAKINSTTNFTTASKINANGGYYTDGTNGYYGAQGLIVDTAGHVWTTGSNGHGELGVGDVSNRSYFTQCVGNLSGISDAKIGGGWAGFGYALSSSGTLYTWGYNGQNNLFLNNSTTPQKTPTAATYVPGLIAAVRLPRSNYLSTYSQLIVQTTAGILAYAGVDNGQKGIDNVVSPGAYSLVPSPRHILDGTETISDVFVHGSYTTQRWFILSNLGNLYACGSNVDSICSGGVTSDIMPANSVWSKIAFS